MSTDKDWPTLPVHLNHLQCMGLLMAINAEQEERGLSTPQVEAKEKLEASWQEHWAFLQRDREARA